MSRCAIALLAIVMVTTAILGAQSVRVADEQRVDWDWGELVYDRIYQGTLTIRNACEMQQVVTLLATRVEGLTVPATATVPARGSVDVPYTISLSQDPGRLQNEPVTGELMITHRQDSQSACPAFRIIHKIAGRVRVAQLADAAADRLFVERSAMVAACRVWWVMGSNPSALLTRGERLTAVRPVLAGLTDRQCAEVVRPYATGLRHRMVNEAAPRTANDWRWLPTEGTIASWSMNELVLFRRRVGEQMAKPK